MASFEAPQYSSNGCPTKMMAKEVNKAIYSNFFQTPGPPSLLGTTLASLIAS